MLAYIFYSSDKKTIKALVSDGIKRIQPMSIFGKNGFVRKQEVAFAKKLLAWKYEKSGMALPDEKTISVHARQIVDDAHIIAKKTGGNVLEILKDAVQDIKKKI